MRRRSDDVTTKNVDVKAKIFNNRNANARDILKPVVNLCLQPYTHVKSQV